MKQLVNNHIKYYFGKIIMPTLGFIFNLITFGLFYNITYFYFFHFNSYCVYKDLLKSYKTNIDLNNWRGHRILLWNDIKMITIHSDNECIISIFHSSNWDKNLNHQIYYLLS